VHSFINLSIVDIYQIANKSWTPLKKKATHEEILSFYKEDSKVLFFFLKELNFHLSRILPNWYLQSSIAAIAFGYLKKRITGTKSTLYTSRQVYEILKENFRGGRNELYFGGVHENVTILDFKSLYNKILLLEFPTGAPVFVQNPKNIDEAGFYQVTVTSNLSLPILPQKKDSRVVYKNGTFSGLFWCEELRVFQLSGGQILRIDYGLIYSSNAAVFKEFAEICLKKRSSASALERALYKTIANASLGYLGFYSTNSQEQVYRNIAIPVIVAARARLIWYQKYIYLNSIPGHVCVYADTDSFFIKNISQEVQLDSENFNIERLRTIVFFGKKKYIALTQSGLCKRVGVSSSLTLSTAIAHVTSC